MKLSVLVLVISLAVNAALLAAFTAKPTLAPPAVRSFFEFGSTRADPSRAAAAEADRAGRRARAVPRDATADKAQLWSNLQPADLATLVGRLRVAGFPPVIVRAIVTAQVESRFAPRMKELARSVTETPYWKGDPGYFMGNAKIFEELNQIYRERSRVLREMLGNDLYLAGPMDPSAAQRRQYGIMSPAKIDLVQRINDDYAEMIGQVRTSMQGVTLPEDREKLALLEREKRTDLAAVLTPEEMLDYEMRSSPLTTRLRTPLSIMDASEAEFRAIHAIQQPYRDVLAPPGGTLTSDTFARRQEATAKINEQIKAALGEARFRDYERATNSEFQQLYRLAQRENVPYETISRAFDLRAPTAEASSRIAEDRSLSPDMKREALKALAQTTRTQILSTLGPAIGPSYVENARWLTHIEQGGAISLLPDGHLGFRRVSTPRTARPAPTH